MTAEELEKIVVRHEMQCLELKGPSTSRASRLSSCTDKE